MSRIDDTPFFRLRGGWLEKLSDAMPRALSGPLKDRNFAAETAIREAWPELVSEQIASHVSVNRLIASTLEVYAENSIWATEIKYLSETIIARCNELVGPGSVKRIMAIPHPKRGSMK